MREEALDVKRRSSLEHEVHRTGEPCGDDRQALALAVLGHQPHAQRLGTPIPAQEAHCGFENAHFRCALPILRPEWPRILPPDSLVGFTSRP